MLKQLRRLLLRALRGSGVFQLVRDSQWRNRRLLILCYHGTSLEDEHCWRPRLYMPSSVLQQRFELLKRGGYRVCPLAEGLCALREGKLLPRSVAITFDDGAYDFYKQAYPLLKSYGFPVTVYQTTYYSDYQKPIFNLICSYMLWKCRGKVLQGKELGLDGLMDLRTELGRHHVVRKLVVMSEEQGLTGSQKNEMAERLARLLEIDYEELLRKRVLHIMSPAEIAELASEGVDFQLHTHRHRTPDEEYAFRKEIEDNRNRLECLTKCMPKHFCYPSGVYKSQFLSWLRQENVISATTCDAGLASIHSDPLLLPRFIDTAVRTSLEFEGWLTGVGSLLALRKAATQKYVPARD